MTLSVDATYENGVLKLAEQLPLKEHEKVRVSLHTVAEVQKALDAVSKNLWHPPVDRGCRNSPARRRKRRVWYIGVPMTFASIPNGSQVFLEDGPSETRNAGLGLFLPDRDG